jgi:hypothetical protein
MIRYKGIANHKKRMASTLHTKSYETVDETEKAIYKRVKKEWKNEGDADVRILMVRTPSKLITITVEEYGELVDKAMKYDMDYNPIDCCDCKYLLAYK